MERGITLGLTASQLEKYCCANSVQEIRLLLEYDIDVSSPSQQYDMTYLFTAACDGFLIIGLVSLLLEAGAIVDTPQSDGSSAFTCACQYNNHELVSILIDRVANPHRLDGTGWTGLHHACWKGFILVIKEFTSRPDSDLEVTVDDKHTPLHIACLYNRADAVIELIRAGANLFAVDSYGAMPLHNACRLMYTKVAIALIEAIASLPGSKHKVNSPDRGSSMTPLHYASQTGAVDIVAALLSHGASTNVRDSSMHTPLQLAKANGHHQIVELIKAAKRQRRGDGLIARCICR